MKPSALMKLQKLREEMEEAQERLQSTEFTGKASGVSVIMQGTREVISVKIDPEILDEVEMLEDAILLAVNDALNQIEEQSKASMEKFSNFGGLGF